MISKDILGKMSQMTGLHLYQQEKDYLLKLFLFFYYKHFQDAIFKGGTCLRYLFGLDRFSEDLDFTIKDPRKFREQVRIVLKDFESVGITSYFIKEEPFKEAYTCEIGFQGPLFNGQKQTQNKFRVDAGLREGILRKPEWKIIKGEYPETSENFLVLALSMEELLIEKIIALFSRKKGRDLYDTWFMLNSGISFDKVLLKKKAKKLSLLPADAIVTKQEYERDMSRLAKRVIPYEQVKKEVMEKMEF